MSDSLVYELASTSDVEEKPFVHRDWLYCNDSNQGSYASGQVIISTETLSNSGKFIDYSQGYLKVPLIVVLTASTITTANGNTAPVDFTTVKGEYLSALKNGHWNLIHSMNVEYNNGPVIQQSNYTNVYASYKAHTSFSNSDLITLGPTLGYYPDTENSWVFTENTATSCGSGSCNNNNAGNTTALFNPALGALANQVLAGNAGMMNRQQNSHYVIGAGTGVAGLDGGSGFIASMNSLLTVQQDRVVPTTTSVSMYITATIRLKDIANLFEKMPMVRGATFKFTINTNQASFQVAKSSATNQYNTTLLTANSSVLSFAPGSLSIPGGGSNPLMIASCMGSGATSGSAGVVLVTDATHSSLISASVNIVQVNSAYHTGMGIAKQSLPVRLYAPAYTMNPLRMEEYLSQGQRRVSYTDIFAYQMYNQPNGPFNQIITNGIANLQKVIIVPFFSSVSNGGFNTLVSPFSSEPSTTSPVVGALTELNVKIGGVNVLQQNIKYGWEAFMQECYGINAINGGITTGLNSGLINQRMWMNNYQYYVFDVSRRLKEEDRVTKSVELYGNINSLVSLDFFIFLELEREIVIDLSTGSRVA